MIREDLVRQAGIPQSYSGETESNTVRRAMDDITRDIVWFLQDADSDLREELHTKYQPSDGILCPETLPTAQLLVDIILGYSS
jgi:hypothetical protein